MLAVLAVLARCARCARLRAAPRGAALARRSFAAPCARWWRGRAPANGSSGAIGRCEMLRIYDVVLEMVGGAARIAEEIERRDSDLARQMRRAAASVALNTAEGMGNTAGHKRQRYQTALGSAREVMACVDVAKAMRYVGKVDAVTLDRMDHVIATLAKLVHRRA